MQNADNRNNLSLELLRRVFDDALRPSESHAYQPDPNQRIRVSEAVRRMGFWPAEYKKALKAQQARELRGEIVHGPRLPAPLNDNGLKFFLEDQVIDGVRGIKKRAAQLANNATLSSGQER